jgi:hypothetical protein
MNFDLNLLDNLDIPENIINSVVEYRNDKRIIEEITESGIGHIFSYEYEFYSKINKNILNNTIQSKINEIISSEIKCKLDECALLYFKNVSMHVDKILNYTSPYIINLIISGTGIIRIHNCPSFSVRKEILVKPGDLIILDPSILHSFEITSNECVISYNTFTNLKGDL